MRLSPRAPTKSIKGSGHCQRSGIYISLHGKNVLTKYERRNILSKQQNQNLGYMNTVVVVKQYNIA